MASRIINLTLLVPTVAARRCVRLYSSDRPKAEPPAEEPQQDKEEEKELGPFAQRLHDATQEALLTGGRAGRTAIADAGFSPALRDRLLAQVASASPAAAAGPASAALSMPPAADRAAQATALARPWTGTEPVSASAQRMLHDAHRELPAELRGNPVRPAGVVVDMRVRREPAAPPGVRVAQARDRAREYAAAAADADADAQDREDRRRVFRERFEPGARALPNTLAGLAGVANERIEEAMARGAFRDIPRGPGVQRDSRVDNPFIDTTEYIMNNMIKRQALMPPWIDKQQELSKAAAAFRARLRSSWTTHLAGLIRTAAGSDVAAQAALAQRNARAEARIQRAVATRSTGHAPSTVTDDAVMKPAATPPATSPADGIADDGIADADTRPLRDEAWLRTHDAYIALALRDLNALMRAYNLLAPDLAKKPYFVAEREVAACFADVAPRVEAVLRKDGARRVESVAGGFFGLRAAAPAAERTVYQSKEPNYGLREMWRDIWKK